MPNYQFAQAMLADLRSNPETDAGVLRNDWIGKAVKWSIGATFTMVGIDLQGNVVIVATCEGTLAATSVLIETFIADGNTYFTSAPSLDESWTTAQHKIATWRFQDITGTLTLQSAKVTSATPQFPHTHGDILDLDLQTIINGTEIGIGSDAVSVTVAPSVLTTTELRAAANLAAATPVTITFTVGAGLEGYLGADWTPSAATAVTNTYAVSRVMTISAGARVMSPTIASGNWATSSTSRQDQLVGPLPPGDYSITITSGAAVAMNSLAVALQVSTP